MIQGLAQMCVADLQNDFYFVSLQIVKFLLFFFISFFVENDCIRMFLMPQFQINGGGLTIFTHFDPFIFYFLLDHHDLPNSILHFVSTKQPKK